MNILVLGGGGREHALVRSINENFEVFKIFCAPGNPGIGETAECINLDPNDFEQIINFVLENEINLTVVGPEKPLCDGIVDAFCKAGLPDKGCYIFGPDQEAAIIEGSKIFTKELLREHNIPTADFMVAHTYNEAATRIQNAIAKFGPKIVIKKDGLAAGKGAIVCNGFEEAAKAAADIMVNKNFGKEKNSIVIEKFLLGEEASIIAVTDGKNIEYLVSSQDHKPVYDGDQGPNTGGMGAYAPAPIINEEVFAKIKTEIMEPVVAAMADEGKVYRGFLYVGLMIHNGQPYVVEFNCRMGDPEAQVILPLMKTDLVAVMYEVAKNGKLTTAIENFAYKSALCVVLASNGYPDDYETGKRINGLDTNFGDGVIIFHAGTKKDNDKILTDGGRVLGITGVANSIKDAQKLAYWGENYIYFENMYFRTDIGNKALKHLNL